MARAKTSPEVAAYLRQLDTALVNVPPDVAEEIRNGIAEELTSLPPEEAHARISQLGDARFIAAEAGAGSDVSVSRRPSLLGSRLYAIVAAVVLAVGAFLVPLVGWAFGYVLVGLSRIWRRWEKVVAVAVPLGLSTLVAGFFAVVGYPAAASTGGSPWISVLPVVTSNAAIVLVVGNAVAGTWLLVRALVRS